MIGLLKKDLYVADRTSRLLLVLALLFSLVPAMRSFGCTYAMMLALMIPINSIAYDEKSKWDRYAAMLPYRVGQIVGSKYLLSYLFTLLGGSIIVLSAVIQGIAVKPADLGEPIQMVAMLGVSMLFVTALGVPILYRFGSEKGRLAMILVMGVGVGIALGLLSIFEERPQLPDLPLPAVGLLVAVLAVGISFGSFRLSVHFYKNRQNGVYS